MAAIRGSARIVLLLASAVFSLGAQNREGRDLEIPTLTAAPKIDGLLDNPTWQKAAVLETFTQYEPQEGAPPSEKTIGYIGYDEQNLYLAFRCFDSDADAVRACLAQRDMVRGDDGITVYLDTFNDKKRAFVFEVNPCGIQNDGVFTEGRRMGGRGGGGGGGGGMMWFERYDRSWDTYFLADAKVDAEGYTVEIAIPFKSLRFPNTPGQVWGFQVMRTIRRKNEDVYWSPRTRNANGFLIQAGTIQFKGAVDTGKNLEVMPVVTAAKQDEAAFKPQAGINVKYGLTSDLTADVTYNPDFSQIESDMPQIDVNQRYTLYYPERRPFFLEGKDFFDTPLELVYTRKIVSPQWGFKLSGKVRKTVFGFLSAMDDSPPAINPTAVLEETEEATGPPSRAWTNIFRLRSDLYEESHLGLILSDKEMGAVGSPLTSDFNRVAGVDGSFKFLDYNRFSFQVLGSQSRVGGDKTGVVSAMTFNLNHQSRHVSFFADWTSLPPDFEAATGFFRRKDINALTTRLGYAILPQNPYLISITPSVEYRRIYDFQKTLTDEEYSLSLFVSGWRQSHIFVNYSTGLERYNGVNFRGRDAWLSFSSEPFAWLSGNVSTNFGDGIYYDVNPYQGYKQVTGVRLTFRPLGNVRLYASWQNDEFYKSRGGEKVYEVNLLTQRLTYQISKPLSIRLITDYDDYYRTLYLSLLLSYEYRPGTVFYFGIDDNQERLGTGVFKRTGRYYFVKFSYWWRI